MTELTALEEQLLADSEGSQTLQLCEQLQRLQQQLQQQLRSPRHPDEYRALQLQLRAAEAAEQVITTLAQRYHNRFFT